MQKDYNGYLVAFGTYQLPNSFLVRYVSTPNQRIESIKSNGLLNLDQRKYSVKYWNLETGLYSEGEFYVPDIEYAISHISDNESGEMQYEAFTLEMIQY